MYTIEEINNMGIPELEAVTEKYKIDNKLSEDEFNKFCIDRTRAPMDIFNICCRLQALRSEELFDSYNKF